MCHKGQRARSGIVKTNGRSREKGVNPQGVARPSRKEKDEAKARRCKRKHGFLPQNAPGKVGRA